ncbi:MAG: AmmeMemoRadiSam system protein B [Magnetococcales bacterium]|nr:AmmeMemoRadiSam system protein B [Magnetococcales bacterium]
MDLRIREPAVAGTFYPKDPQALRAMIHMFLDQVPSPSEGEPLAMVLPHAGYVYSGLTAAHGYRCLNAAPAHRPRRVFLLSPSHRVYQEGISVGNYSAFATPLGEVPVDHDLVASLAALPDVTTDPASHQKEHALEVHLPFLQETLVHIRLVPIVFGEISGGHLADIVARFWTPGDLVIVSSDLSHYHPYDQAKRLDAQCHEAVLSGNPRTMAQCEACGNTGMAALLELGRRQRWHAKLLDYRNSGDTAGDKSRVVGYASYAFHPGNAAVEVVTTAGASMEENTEGAILEQLPSLARAHLEAFLAGTPGGINREQLMQTHASLARQGACFVTLTKKGRLRGCIGSLQAHRSLLDDLMDNSVAAAIRDTRFRPLVRKELDEVAVEVSILTPAVRLVYEGTQDLLEKLQPGVHGVILFHAGRRATFLPQVWEQLPDPQTFLTHLCQKAGLDGMCWQHHPEIQVYTVRKIKESVN